MIAPLATAKSAVVKLITLANGTGVPDGNTRRSPKSVGPTTVTFRAAALAVFGTPQLLTTGKLRVVFFDQVGDPRRDGDGVARRHLLQRRKAIASHKLRTG